MSKREKNLLAIALFLLFVVAVILMISSGNREIREDRRDLENSRLSLTWSAA